LANLRAGAERNSDIRKAAYPHMSHDMTLQQEAGRRELVRIVVDLIVEEYVAEQDTSVADTDDVKENAALCVP